MFHLKKKIDMNDLMTSLVSLKSGMDRAGIANKSSSKCLLRCFANQ